MIFSLVLACSSPEAPPKPAEPAKPDEAPKPPEAPKPAAGEVIVKGSDSELNVVQKMAEAFQAATPGAKVSVTGGGSGAGIAALMDGTTTIANASRDLSAEEKAGMVGKGMTPSTFVFATDAVAVIVNKDNPVGALTVEQVGAIFKGETKAWTAVGGKGDAIGLYGRQSSSGTYDYVKKTVLAKAEYAATLKQLTGNAEIVEAVAHDATGIGYVAAGYLKDKAGIKPLGLKVGADTVLPTDKAAVLAGKYPLARPLFHFTSGKPTGTARDFMAFEAGEAGQKIVEDMGFYPIFDDKKAANAALLAP